MELLSPELQETVAKIADDNGFKNFEVNRADSVSKDGDGYIGILEALCIADKDSDKKLHVVVKKAPSNVNLRAQFPTRPAFLREIIMYNEIFPAFKSFQEEHNIPKPFDAVADIYGFNSDEFKEFLVLKNLKEEGFRLCDRKEPMDSHHLTLALTAYAKLHAVSHAMRRLDPERFKRDTGKVWDNIMVNFQPSNPGIKDPKSVAAQAMASEIFKIAIKCVEDNPRLVEALEDMKKVGFDNFITESLHVAEDEFSVVSHADCWSANLMFKYEDESNPNIPTKVNLIDWQMSALSFPAHDISYVFFINAGKSELRNYMKYLNVYYTALCENLTAFGLDPKSFYPFELLEEQWKKKCKIGFFMCLLMLPQTLSDKKTHDFEKMAEAGEDLFDMKKRDNVISDRLRQRMGDLVEFLVDNQLI